MQPGFSGQLGCGITDTAYWIGRIIAKKLRVGNWTLVHGGMALSCIVLWCNRTGRRANALSKFPRKARGAVKIGFAAGESEKQF
jgi:hypothetical protein